jgi:hypothetical protein
MTDHFDIRNSAFGLCPVLANPPFNDSDWFCKDDDASKLSASKSVYLYVNTHANIL